MRLKLKKEILQEKQLKHQKLELYFRYINLGNLQNFFQKVLMNQICKKNLIFHLNLLILMPWL